MPELKTPAFKVGDEVYILGWKKFGKVVELMVSGKLKVAIGNLTVLFSPAELTELSQSPKSQRIKKRKLESRPSSVRGQNRSHRGLRIDLHGRTVEESLRELEKAINDCLLYGHEKLEVIHGIGSGRVQGAVHQYLQSLDVVSDFREHQANPGVTWVYF